MMTPKEQELLEVVEIHSTLQELEKFKESFIFKDFLQHVGDRITYLHRQLEQTTDYQEMLRTQGGLANLRLMLDWVDRLIQAKKMEEDDGQNSDQEQLAD